MLSESTDVEFWEPAIAPESSYDIPIFCLPEMCPERLEMPMLTSKAEAIVVVQGVLGHQFPNMSPASDLRRRWAKRSCRATCTIDRSTDRPIDSIQYPTLDLVLNRL